MAFDLNIIKDLKALAGHTTYSRRKKRKQVQTLTSKLNNFCFNKKYIYIYDFFLYTR